MAAVQPETALSAPPGSDTPPPGAETPQGPPLSLSPEEVKQRLQATRSQLENRRKILIRNLPGDCSSQDIHDLLKDYEVKYCYVDKNKKTAFITLLNGEQAQDAIRRFHQRPLRDKELSVQLQPTDALLCVTNLPPTLTLQGFEEMVRAHGSTERCLLVYSELSGRSKGYGFVEYMKKDSASKARLELLGKPLEERTLLAQWMDVNQLTADVIHSKCLCVDKLPKDLRDPEELTRLFSSPHAPVFCQLADDDGSCSAGFAVVEYESAEQAEEVRDAMDQTLIMGSKIQVSFCAPGAPGRSTLAALIAAHGMLQNNRKGLLPEPNPAQIMQSLNNPAMLQMLLQPPQRGRSGKHGASSGRPHFINPTVSQALLQLNKLHQQKHGLGNSGSVLLQNYSHLQMAQQQLLQLKSAQSHNSKPGLLGEAPGSMLQTALGSAQPGAGDASQREAQKNMMPYYQHMGPDLARMSQDKQPEGSASQTLLQHSASMVTGQSQANSAESALPNKPSNQTSLLGEPPREIRLSTNPYLNLASVLPGSSLAGLSTRTLQYAMDGSGSQEPTGQPALENYFSYGQQYGDYAQEAQQWYSPYAAYTTPQTAVPTEESHPSSTAAFGDYSAYVQAPPTYYASAQGTYQTGSAESIAKTTTNEKRAYTGPASKASTAEYADQYSSPEGSADTYSDTYFKRKKVF